MKAIRFSEKIKKEIQEAKKAIIDRMYSEMEAAKASEALQRSDALGECRRNYDDFRRKATERIEQRKAEYENLKSLFYSGNFSSPQIGGLSSLQGKLRDFLGYQDADILWKDISTKIQEKDKQIQALKERESEILYHEFANIKGFNKGRKREKLQLELDEVQKKIRTLQEELQGITCLNRANHFRQIFEFDKALDMLACETLYSAARLLMNFPSSRCYITTKQTRPGMSIIEQIALVIDVPWRVKFFDKIWASGHKLSMTFLML